MCIPWLFLFGGDCTEETYCSLVSSVHGFVIEQKNLKFLLTSCVPVFSRLCYFGCIGSDSTSWIFKWKIDRKRDQALPWFSYSLNVMDCVCTCRPIQCNSMCYATHACVWRMQLDLLNRVCTFGFFTWNSDVGRVLFGTGCPISKNSLWFILSALDASETLTCLYCMTDRPGIFSKFTAWLKNDPPIKFCTLWHWVELTSAPSPLSLLSFFL